MEYTLYASTFCWQFFIFFAFLYENDFDNFNFKYVNEISLSDKCKIAKIYNCTTITDIVNISLDLYLQKKIYINSCQNCNRYFIPVNRRDEKYYNC